MEAFPFNHLGSRKCCSPRIALVFRPIRGNTKGSCFDVLFACSSKHLTLKHSVPCDFSRHHQAIVSLPILDREARELLSKETKYY